MPFTIRRSGPMPKRATRKSSKRIAREAETHKYQNGENIHSLFDETPWSPLSESPSSKKKKSRYDQSHEPKYRKNVQPKNESQAQFMQAVDMHSLAVSMGPAGTGKTYIAIAKAVEALERGDVNRIILSRPAIEAGEKLGFLPGDMEEKLSPYLRPLYDALYDVLHTDFVDRRIASGDIEIAPLAFMRGRTLTRAAVILDEAQNATPAQMKMFLTRLGEHSRMIITGDPTQTDLPEGAQSGLVDALSLLSDLPDVEVVKFTSADVVRHHLVAKIVQAYDRRAKHLRRGIAKTEEQ